MGSLQDSSDFGVADTSDQTYYESSAEGLGRWIRVDGIGTLWTDDANALQLAKIPDDDPDRANEIRRSLHNSAAEGVSATSAFDRLAARLGLTPTRGDLSDLPRS